MWVHQTDQLAVDTVQAYHRRNCYSRATPLLACVSGLALHGTNPWQCMHFCVGRPAACVYVHLAFGHAYLTD